MAGGSQAAQTARTVQNTHGLHTAEAPSDGSDDDAASDASVMVGALHDRNAQLSLYAWGSNNAHQLPVASKEQALATPTKSAFFSAPHVAPLMIAAGGSHALCLTDEGELFAWGAGARGQLGLGAAVSQCDAPRAVVCGERVNVRSPRWSERPSCRWCAAGATAPACPLRATCTRGARAPTASLARDSTWTARSSQWCSTSCAGRTSAAWIQDVRMSRRLPADRTTRCS